MIIVEVPQCNAAPIVQVLEIKNISGISFNDTIGKRNSRGFSPGTIIVTGNSNLSIPVWYVDVMDAFLEDVSLAFPWTNLYSR